MGIGRYATEEQRLARNAYMRQWRREHPDSVRATFRRWSEKNADAQAAYRHEWDKKNANVRVEYAREWRKKNPEKRAAARKRAKERYPEKHTARRFVYDKIRRGKLIRPSQCGQCNVECKPEAHHRDYTKPLEIEWLCLKCHREADKEERAEGVDNK